SLLLSFTAIAIVANFIVGTVLTHTLPDPNLAFMAYGIMYHVYIAFYMIVTIDVTLSALFLWNGLPESSAATEKVRLPVRSKELDSW
ncbi:hypothetical protein, partial [Alkalibacillus haloalkaliphilus]|uniref:hypothetical protein n=1 Tax=Alkalibacillus haloalkaliphilus TaxID=94136 RepID=UPI0029359596